MANEIGLKATVERLAHAQNAAGWHSVGTPPEPKQPPKLSRDEIRAHVAALNEESATRRRMKQVKFEGRRRDGSSWQRVISDIPEPPESKRNEQRKQQ